MRNNVLRLERNPFLSTFTNSHQQCVLIPHTVTTRYFPTSSSSTTTSTATSTRGKNNHSVHKNSSSNPNEATLNNSNNNNPNNSQNYLKVDPRAIFPWRHSPHPLPRLIPNTDEFQAQGGYIGPQLPPWNAFVRGLSWINATGFLGGRIMGYFGWKDELEEGFKVAFAAAVQGLLMDVYRGMYVYSSYLDEIYLESEMTFSQHMNAHHSILVTDNSDEEAAEDASSNANNDDIINDSDEDDIFPKQRIQFNQKINPLPEDEIPTDIQHDKSIQTQTRDMLDSHLISLYKSAHECMKHKLQIHLQSIPKSAQIMSLVTIPFLTHKEIQQTPALKHSFRDIWKGLQQVEYEKGSQLTYFEIGNFVAYQLDEMANRQMIRRGDGMMQVTVIAQVAIECDEIFQVVDVFSLCF